MPQNPSAWSAWNFLGTTSSGVSVTYWLNLLQVKLTVSAIHRLTLINTVIHTELILIFITSWLGKFRTSNLPAGLSWWHWTHLMSRIMSCSNGTPAILFHPSLLQRLLWSFSRSKETGEYGSAGHIKVARWFTFFQHIFKFITTCTSVRWLMSWVTQVMASMKMALRYSLPAQLFFRLQWNIYLALISMCSIYRRLGSLQLKVCLGRRAAFFWTQNRWSRHGRKLGLAFW